MKFQLVMDQDAYLTLKKLLSEIKFELTEDRGFTEEYIKYKDRVVFINGFTSFYKLNQRISSLIAEYKKFIESNINLVKHKHEAEILLLKQHYEFTELNDNFILEHDFFIRFGQRTVNQNLFWDPQIKLNLIHYPDNEFRDIATKVSAFQLDSIKKILDSINYFKEVVNKIPKSEWERNIITNTGNPFLILDKDIKLTDKKANFKSELDKYQAVLFYHYFEKANVFYPYFNKSESGKFIYYLTGVSDDSTRKILDDDFILSIKKDSIKKGSPKNPDGVNLSKIESIIENILSKIREDRIKFAQRIKKNNI